MLMTERFYIIYLICNRISSSAVVGNGSAGGAVAGPGAHRIAYQGKFPGSCIQN